MAERMGEGVAGEKDGRKHWSGLPNTFEQELTKTPVSNTERYIERLLSQLTSYSSLAMLNAMRETKME